MLASSPLRGVKKSHQNVALRLRSAALDPCRIVPQGHSRSRCPSSLAANQARRDTLCRLPRARTTVGGTRFISAAARVTGIGFGTSSAEWCRGGTRRMMNRGPNLATDRSRLLPGGNSARSRQVRYMFLGTKSPWRIRGNVWSVPPGISSLCFDADQRKRYAVWI